MKPFIFAGLLFCLAASSAAEQPTGGTETVLVTHRVREGKEAAYAKALAREWSTLRRLGLVLERPHVVLSGADESGKPVFVEILTWKDHDAPDNVPPEVGEIWKEMESLVERRLGHRGIEFPEFEIAVMEDCPAAAPPGRSPD
jgi:hypothetical protein